ncbi:MAG: hypothetical protein AB8B56_04335 [Crocinitomicaceae bacterium]
MSMNLIQENTKEVEFFTSLRDVERWLEINLEDYDWHLSDTNVSFIQMTDPIWLTGNELKSKIMEYDYQFVWAVISAFPNGTEPTLSDTPYADGNPDFWHGIPKKQLADSLFEIVCWDSSATLFIDLPEVLGNRTLKNAPGISDLNALNQKNV